MSGELCGMRLHGEVCAADARAIEGAQTDQSGTRRTCRFRSSSDLNWHLSVNKTEKSAGGSIDDFPPSQRQGRATNNAALRRFFIY